MFQCFSNSNERRITVPFRVKVQFTAVCIWFTFSPPNHFATTHHVIIQFFHSSIFLRRLTSGYRGVWMKCLSARDETWPQNHCCPGSAWLQRSWCSEFGRWFHHLYGNTKTIQLYSEGRGENYSVCFLLDVISRKWHLRLEKEGLSACKHQY